jgi:NADH:ubiquinone oxidoreductase subunit 2 (subunit N)
LTTAKRLYSFEYDYIIAFSILGLLLVNLCNDFLMLYLAIELQSLCFYVLATFNKNSEYCVEAGIKYFVLGAFASGLLLFSFVLFYISLGSLCFESFEKVNVLNNTTLSFVGVLCFSLAIFFKLGVFPFHS